MTTAEEPVAFGLAKSLARPGGNITGVAVVPGAEIYGKILELLTEVLPKGARIGVLFDATASVNALWLQATEEAAWGLGVTLVPAGVRSAEDFERWASGAAGSGLNICQASSSHSGVIWTTVTKRLARISSPSSTAM